MAICVNAVVGVAPCQCFSLGGNQTTSPGRISSIGSSQLCAQPRPNVTINVCPSGCVCQAVRAPGSNVTLAPRTRAGSGASNKGSIRTEPVNQSAGPLLEDCAPDRLISMSSNSAQLLNRSILPLCGNLQIWEHSRCTSGSVTTQPLADPLLLISMFPVSFSLTAIFQLPSSISSSLVT